MTLKHDEEIKVKDDKIDQLLDSNKRLEKYVRSLGISLEEVKDQNEELLDNNKGLDKEVKKVQRKLGIAVEDRAPLPDDKKKQERFVLIKRNDPDYLPYYTIRAQNDYTSRRLRSQKALFPDMEVLLDFRSNPNSKTLYVRIKDNLKARGVTFEGNNIDLNEAITEDYLIDEMKVINDQKYEV
jgi:regulator of replication initiation timing